MKKIDFGFKVFIMLFILCIAGVVFSTIAIDKQIDSYIEQLQMEVHVINNTDDNVTIEKEDNKMIITINPTEENEEVIIENNETDEYGIVTSISGLNVRQDPSIESEKVDILEYGARVKILEDCGDWYRTENGFIFKEFVIKI